MKIAGTSDLGRLAGLKRASAETRAAMGKAATEMTTGEKTSRLDATSGDITRLFAVERALDRNAAFANTVALAGSRLDMTQNTLGLILSPVQDLADGLATTAGMGDVAASLIHANRAREAFADTVNALNTRAGGLSLFAGTATDTAALAPAEMMLAELDTIAGAAGTAAEAIDAINAWFAPGGGFHSSGYVGSADDLAPADLGEGRRLDYAVRADAEELTEVLRAQALAAVVAGGAFAGDSDAQMEILDASGVAMMSAREGLLDLRSAVGVSQETVENAKAARTAEKDTLDLARNAIMSVDMGESATIYQAFETQLRTIYTVTARLGELSFVKYM